MINLGVKVDSGLDEWIWWNRQRLEQCVKYHLWKYWLNWLEIGVKENVRQIGCFANVKMLANLGHLWDKLKRPVNRRINQHFQVVLGTRHEKITSLIRGKLVFLRYDNPYTPLQGESDNHQSEFACIYEEGERLERGWNRARSAIKIGPRVKPVVVECGSRSHRW